MASSTDPELIPIFYKIPFGCGAEIVSGYLEKKKCRGSDSKRFYGHFECSGCGARWNSSNTWQGYTQGCKKCNIHSWPIKVYHLEQSADTEVGRSHITELCEKCQELGHNCSTGGHLNINNLRYQSGFTIFDQCYKKQYQLFHYNIILEPSFIRNLYDAVWYTLDEKERREFRPGLEIAKGKWDVKERSDLVDACQEVLDLINTQNYPNRPMSSGLIQTKSRLISSGPTRNMTPDERPKSSDHCRMVFVDKSQSKDLGFSRKVADENRPLICRLYQTEKPDVIRPKSSGQSQSVLPVRSQPAKGHSRNVVAKENRPVSYEHGQTDVSQKVHICNRSVISDEGRSKYLGFSENAKPKGSQSKVLDQSRKVFAEENLPVNCKLNQTEIIDAIRPKSSEHNRRVPADDSRPKKDDSFIRCVTSGESRPIGSGLDRKAFADVNGPIYYKPRQTVKADEIRPKSSDLTRKVPTDRNTPLKYGQSRTEFHSFYQNAIPNENRSKSSGLTRTVPSDRNLGMNYGYGTTKFLDESRPKTDDKTADVISKSGREPRSDDLNRGSSDLSDAFRAMPYYPIRFKKS